MGVDKPAPFHVAEAVVHLRTKKLPDPDVIGNAGSFFKNPIVERALAEALARAHPGLVSWPAGEAHSKLSAAWLIEQAGFKGLREGRRRHLQSPCAGAGQPRQRPAASSCGRWRNR